SGQQRNNILRKCQSAGTVTDVFIAAQQERRTYCCHCTEFECCKMNEVYLEGKRYVQVLEIDFSKAILSTQRVGYIEVLADVDNTRANHDTNLLVIKSDIETYRGKLCFEPPFITGILFDTLVERERCS